ncbi:hypothetical protein ACROYT_G024825 [Oculina patagonica]
MLRETFWVYFKRELTQTLDSWVVTVKERATECKFQASSHEQAVKDKLTFSYKEDNYKLKLYDDGAALSLEKAVKTLPLKKATTRELRESKIAEIESVTLRVDQVLETVDDFSPTFVGGVTTSTCPNTSMAEPAAIPQTGKSDPVWHVKLKSQDQDMLTSCTVTGAQVSVMPEAINKVAIWDAFKTRQRSCWSRGCSI